MRMSGNKIILKSSLVINRTPRKNMENHRFWIYTPSFGNDSMKTVAFIETRSLLPKSSRVKLCQIIQVNVTHTNVWIHQGWSFKTRLQLLPHHANQKNHWSNSIDVRLFLKKTSFFTLCIVRTSPYFRVSGASRWNNDPALYTNTLYIYNQLVSQRCECVCVCFHLLLFFLQRCVIQFQHSSDFQPNSSAAKVPSQVETILCGRIACEVQWPVASSEWPFFGIVKWPYENGKWPLTKGINKVTLNSLFFVVVFLSGLLQAISLCSWWSLQVGVPCGPWCIVPTRLNSKKRIGGIMCFMPKLHRHFAEFKLITYGALMARDRNRCCLSNFYRFFSWNDPYIRSLFFPSCLTPIYHVKKFFELATLVVQSVSHCPWYKYKLMFGISPARITWNWYTKYILQPIHPQDSIPGNTWASIQTVPMNWPGLGRTLEWALHAVLASMFAKPFLLLSVPLKWLGGIFLHVIRSCFEGEHT